jgi:hypothetical protein
MSRLNNGAGMPFVNSFGMRACVACHANFDHFENFIACGEFNLAQARGWSAAPQCIAGKRMDMSRSDYPEPAPSTAFR